MASPMLQSPVTNGYQHAPSQNGTGNASPALSPTHLNGTARPQADDFRSSSAVPHPSQQPSPVQAPNQTPIPVPVPGTMADKHRELPENPRNRIFANTPASAIQDPEPLPRGQKFANDYWRLYDHIRYCDPDVVRRVVRDHFERCLLGSDYHLSFVFHVALARTSTRMLQTVFGAFKHRLVPECRDEIATGITPKDLDAMADILVSKANNGFLDKALVKRLPTIEARRLVNALARAGRLGYDTDDIVEDEHVIPTVPPSNQMNTIKTFNPANSQMTKAQKDHLSKAERAEKAAAQKITQMENAKVALFISRVSTGHQFTYEERMKELPNPPPPQQPGHYDHIKPRCTYCLYAFEKQDAWRHHARKRVCLKPRADPGPNGEILTCHHCLQTFSGLGGLQYHLMNKVCGDFGPVNKDDIQPNPQVAALNPPTKRPAPDSTSTPIHATPTHMPSTYTLPGTQSTPSFPVPAPTQTPQAPSTQSNILQDAPLGTPQPKDMSHLTAHQIEALLGELRRAEDVFKAKIDDAMKAQSDPAELQKRLASFKNSFACKQSTIRKKYGVKLRERRGRAAMDAERTRMGYGTLPAGTPTSNDKHVDKRARVNAAGDSAAMPTTPAPTQQDTPTQTQQGTPAQTQQSTPTKQVAVKDMSNGLNGSNATVALEDPTASMAPKPAQSKPAQSELTTSSTYQQGNYRVSVTAPNPPDTVKSSAPDVATPSPSVPQAGATMTAEALLRQMQGSSAGSDKTDSDSSSDDGDHGPAQ